MSSTTDATHTAACSVSTGEECTCGGGCEAPAVDADLSAKLESAAAVGCTITETEAPAQLARIEQLRPHLVGIDRRRGSLTISFDHGVNSGVLDGLIEVEQGCCSFLQIVREDAFNATRVVFSTEDADREPALALIARTFDPAGPDPRPRATSSDRREKAILGALGIACLACLLPGILAAGAIGSFAAALGGEAAMAATLGLLFAVAALVTVVRRRSQSDSASCGC